MPVFVVIDTNVLVSALLSKHADAATVQIIDRLYRGVIVPLISEKIMAEYDEVLHRPKFRFPGEVIRRIKHFPVKTFIVTPNEMPDILKSCTM